MFPDFVNVPRHFSECRTDRAQINLFPFLPQVPDRRMVNSISMLLGSIGFAAAMDGAWDISFFVIFDVSLRARYRKWIRETAAQFLSFGGWALVFFARRGFCFTLDLGLVYGLENTVSTVYDVCRSEHRSRDMACIYTTSPISILVDE